ncbi:hypothetical protein ACFU44_00280 [Nocardia rhizosphaerihabitans]|uniref:hypothetical protein n=1 Tax=Nocardia rhizosphaerihabitans TaxID=1691570 RepID=UPI00366DCEF0
MATALGDSAPSTFRLSDSQVNALALGDSIFWVSFIPSGMNKNGTSFQLTSGSGVYQEVAGWVADTAGYPGSTISGNGVVVQAAATNATVSVSLAYRVPSNATTHTADVQVYRGATLIGTTTPAVSCPPGATTTVAGSITGVTLSAGDVITVRTKRTNAFSAFVDPGSWCRVTVPA